MKLNHLFLIQSVNVVLKPVTALPDTEIEPDKIALNRLYYQEKYRPYNVKEPAIPICLTADNSKFLTPGKPNCI